MKRVTGIGGVFFKCTDPEQMKTWYRNHLGIESDQYGGCFQWYRNDGSKGHTVWSTFKEDSQYFQPSTKPFMFNYRVEDLEQLLHVLKEEGITQVSEMEVLEYGKFAWIMDPDGNKIELWQPLDFEKIVSVSQEME